MSLHIHRLFAKIHCAAEDNRSFLEKGSVFLQPDILNRQKSFVKPGF